LPATPIVAPYSNLPQASVVVGLVHAIQQLRVLLRERRYPAAARRRKGELASNTWHYFGDALLYVAGLAAREFLRWKMLSVPICLEIRVYLGVDQEDTGRSLSNPGSH
jgi:hypothetical protein